MCSSSVVVVEVLGENAVKMPLVEHHNVIETLLPDGADQTFDVTNVSVNLDYLAGGGWQVSGGVQWFGGTALDSLLFEFRLDYRF